MCMFHIWIGLTAKSLTLIKVSVAEYLTRLGYHKFVIWGFDATKLRDIISKGISCRTQNKKRVVLWILRKIRRVLKKSRFPRTRTMCALSVIVSCAMFKTVFEGPFFPCFRIRGKFSSNSVRVLVPSSDEGEVDFSLRVSEKICSGSLTTYSREPSVLPVLSFSILFFLF